MEEDLLSRRLHKFNAKRGEDFNLWSLRFEALLESKNLLDVITSDPLERTTFSQLNIESKSQLLKDKSLLVQSLGDKPLRTVAGEKNNPCKMYEKLQDRYATQNKATRVQLQTELYQQTLAQN